MTVKQYRVEFPATKHPTVELPEGVELSEHFDTENSPILFGCRGGVCASCLADVDVLDGGALAAPGDDESELLDIFAPGNEKARLCCQIQLTANLSIRVEA